ncbi:hypothetical protein GALMADRAFT_147985 [Galerina marginata CBS 339.88]|uniref:PH domain-containing protein n=1 Tax=Galerina marginata (strain CBS 339.88) TaxID=685588 RepID=A0A067S8Z9_GALM3|nr:hypothetical protein GALMADRAFT_147985 [Galerina marginata CBS 339.88]
MATYRRAYMFTGEPSATEDAADWLAALETNMYPSNTSRDKVNLFSTKLYPKSPAKQWFNGLPDETQRRYHLLRPEFESRWCTNAPPCLVAQISTISVAVPIPTVSPTILATTQHSCSVPAPLPSAAPIIIPKLLPSPLTTTTSNMIHMTKNEFDRMLKDSYRRGSEDGFKKGFMDASEKLRATHEEAIADVLDGAREHCDGEYVNAFELGRTSGIQDQREYHESLRKPLVAVGIQVDLPPDDETFFTPSVADILLPPTSEIGSQTSPSIFPTPLPLPNPSLLLSPVPILSTLIPIPILVPTSPPKLSWADDSASLPIIPLIKTPRDLSGLRSNNKPFGTIRHRNRRHLENSRRRSTPPVHVPSSNTNRYIPRSSQRYPHLSPPLPHPNVTPFLPPVLDWDGDPRLFELSRVLRSLGWSHSPFSRS